MGRPKKEASVECEELKASKVETTNLYTEKKKVDIYVKKRISVEKYQREKIPFSQTEAVYPFLSDEECYNIYQKEMEGKGIAKRFELILRTLGEKEHSRTLYYSFISIYKLLPYACNNLHLFLFGEKNTGKTSGFTAFSDMPLILSEQPTAAILRGNRTTNNTPKEKIALLSEILCLDEVADYDSSDVISILKSYESSNNISIYGTDEKKSSCSIVMCANTLERIKCFTEIIAKNIMNGVVKDFSTEAFLDRQAGLLYHMDVPLLTKNSFLNGEENGFNINIFLGALRHMKKKAIKLKNIPIPSDIPIRKHAIIEKAVTGLTNILYPDNEPPEYVLKGLLDITLHFILILNNESYNPFKNSNMRFILELIKPEGLEVEKEYLLENRILLKSEDTLIKIPLNPFGVIENRKEIEFYFEHEKNKNIPISPISPGSTEMKIIQKYYPLYSKDNIFDKDGNIIPFNYELKKIKDDYNQLLLKHLLLAGKNNSSMPIEKFIEREVLSKEQCQKKVSEFFPLNKNYICSYTYSYDGVEKIIIINFADLI